MKTKLLKVFSTVSVVMILVLFGVAIATARDVIVGDGTTPSIPSVSGTNYEHHPCGLTN